MSKLSKSKKTSKTDYYVNILTNVLTVLLCVGFVALIVHIYFNVYKPEEKKYIKRSRYVYKVIQSELTEFYKTKQYVYKKDEATDEYQDEFCELLVSKYSNNGGNCTSSDFLGLQENFTFKKNKATIYGMEKPPFYYDGTLVKDFIVDVDGKKGKNTIGIDRVPLRIYSTGRMGGLLTPVNCNQEDEQRFYMERSKLCDANVQINFLSSKIPIGFDIIQIGSKNGKSRKLNTNIPFLRADCLAFGAEMLGFDDYCEQRMYHWMTACYHEYPCAVQLTGLFKD